MRKMQEITRSLTSRRARQKLGKLVELVDPISLSPEASMTAPEAKTRSTQKCLNSRRQVNEEGRPIRFAVDQF